MTTMDVRGGLRQLLTQSEEYGSVDALCVGMTGDFVAGMMLHRLLNWFSKAKTGDGSVYKSWRDWWLELHIGKPNAPSKQITKWKAALAWAGIETYRSGKYSRGVTTHYRLNIDLFIKRVSVVLNVSEETVSNFLSMREKAFSASSEEREKAISPDEREPGKNITKQQQHNTIGGGGESDSDPEAPVEINQPPGERDDIDVPDEAIALGLDVFQVRRLVKLRGYGEVAAVAAEAAVRRGLTNRAGWAFKTLVEHRVWTPSKSPAPARISSLAESEFDSLDNLLARRNAEREKCDTPEPDAPPEARDIWQAAMWQLELQLDRGNFDTYLRKTKPVDLSQNTLTVQARNEHAASACQHRLYRTIRRIVQDTSGREIEVKFVAKPSREAAMR